MAPGLDEITTLPKEDQLEKHRLYTDHAPEALAALADVFSRPGPSPVLILAGPPGCGRTGLLEAAAHGAGQEVRVLAMDLEGYEEGLELQRFVNVQLARRWELDDAARERLGSAVAPWAQGLVPSLSSAAALSLALAQEEPAAAADLVRELSASAGPGQDGREVLAELLRRLSRGGRRVVVHAVANAQLTDPLRERLLAEAAANPGLVLAVSCSPLDTDDAVAPRAERLRLDLKPLPAGDRLDAVQEAFHEIELETADRLQRFLDLAALCGSTVPAEVLFHHLELDEEQQEEVLDAIDEELVEAGERRLFVDHQYGHPSFPGLLAYGFLSPRLNHAILEPLRDDKRARMASELLDVVDRSVPLHTRGMAFLRLSLADHTGDPERREGYARDLRVWVGEDEVDDLAASLARRVEDGAETASELLNRAIETEGRWPPHCRLAFAEAAARGELDPASRMALHQVRAAILREMGRREEALEGARAALEEARTVYGPESLPAVDAMNLLGVLLRETGQPEEARLHLERALEIRGRAEAGVKDPKSEAQRTAALGSLLANLGLTRFDLGQPEAAREPMLQALELHRQALGDIHPAVAADLRNLAVISRALGDPRQALEFVRPVVDIVRRIYGDVHPSTSQALTDVATVLRELKEHDGARLHLEAALQIDQQIYGERHPQVAADLSNLALVENVLGDPESARQHMEQALAIAESAVGPDHPLTVQIRRNLGEG